jgi:catechol 2,3-dioxygenase-like lactoylglutathione lyase family enzyme
MFKIAVPILPVESSERAEGFYGEKLGFKRIYAYRPDPESKDPAWLGMVRDGAHIVLSSFHPDGPPGSASIQFYVEDLPRLRQEMAAAGIELGDDEVFDQDWGNLEFNLEDPDGNRINVAQDKSAGI